MGAGASPDGRPHPQAHALWGKKHPSLLSKFENLVVDRVSYNKLVVASESLTIEKPEGTLSAAALRQDIMLRVIKRLLSSEAGRPFLRDVPEDEVAYYEATETPMCLTTIEAKLEQQEYDTWAAFAEHVQLIVGNAYAFNADDSLPFYLASMLEHEFTVCKKLVEQNAPAVLLT